MKGLSGLDTLKGLRAEGVDARILILTVSDAKMIFSLSSMRVLMAIIERY